MAIVIHLLFDVGCARCRVLQLPEVDPSAYVSKVTKSGNPGPGQPI